MPPTRLSTGVPALDTLLGGGLETDGLTEIYGEGGSGKSIFCLAVAARVALADRWVFYVDTEGLSFERLESTAGGNLPAVLRRLLIATPKDLDEQSKAVENAVRLARDSSRNVGLIVLDSATFYYRLALRGDEDTARQSLSTELASLLHVALTREVAVVFTNQVWRNQKDGGLEPLGGSFVNHVAKTILRFDRRPGAVRRATLVKHRSLPEGTAEFRITPSGLA